MFKTKGQGTTEYLIILAVIIVIALVVAGVMGWFPGLSTGITESQSKAYWQSTSPFAITQYNVTTGSADFVVRNMTTDKIQLNEITIDGTAGAVADANVSAGGTTTVSGATAPTCTTGEAYQYDIVISYDVVNGISGATQRGQKPLVGICG